MCKGTFFQNLMKIIIVILCVYIGVRCVSIITKEEIKDQTGNVINDASDIIVKELVENGDVMKQYMLYIENHKSLSTAAKKKVLNEIVSEYIAKSEYTYNIDDPGYKQVINLVYENAKSAETKENPTTKKNIDKTNKTTKKIKKDKAVKTATKTIVPKPKINGKVYTESNIGSFNNILSKYYIVTSATTFKEADMPLKSAINEKFKIKGNNKKPQILIYHTHSREEFVNSNGNDDTTIIGVGDRLCKILKEQFGYNVIHDKTYYDIVNGRLDRNEAYDQSRVGVRKIIKKYPSISLILDVHRDGVNTGTKLVTEINGKSTAQVMFFNGMSRFKTTGDIGYLYNPYLYENLALAFQMKLNAECYYPGFARYNYVNAYKYNLDLCKQSMLIEVGAQTNTYQEAKNAAEPLAWLINIVMGKNKDNN